MKTEKTWWARLVELISKNPKSKIQNPLMACEDITADEERDALLGLKPDDKLWRVLRYFSLDYVRDNIQQSFDMTKTPEARLDCLNRAAGVSAVMEQIQIARERWLLIKEEQERRREAASRK